MLFLGHGRQHQRTQRKSQRRQKCVEHNPANRQYVDAAQQIRERQARRHRRKIHQHLRHGAAQFAATICRGFSAVIATSSYVLSSRSAISERNAEYGTINNQWKRQNQIVAVKHLRAVGAVRNIGSQQRDAVDRPQPRKHSTNVNVIENCRLFSDCRTSLTNSGLSHSPAVSSRRQSLPKSICADSARSPRHGQLARMRHRSCTARPPVR